MVVLVASWAVQLLCTQGQLLSVVLYLVVTQYWYESYPPGPSYTLTTSLHVWSNTMPTSCKEEPGKMG